MKEEHKVWEHIHDPHHTVTSQRYDTGPRMRAGEEATPLELPHEERAGLVVGVDGSCDPAALRFLAQCGDLLCILVHTRMGRRRRIAATE